VKSSLQRFEKYRSTSNFQLLPQIPILVEVELSSFSKIIKNFSPSDLVLWYDLFYNLLIQTASDIPYVVFAYFTDSKLIFILRPDLYSAEKYNLQELNSLFSSTITAKFYQFISLSEYQKFNSSLSFIFHSFVFSLPSLNEIYNYLVTEQNISFRKKIVSFLRVELEKSHSRSATSEFLRERDFSEKLEWLKSLGFDFTANRTFLRGTAAYKIPFLLENDLRKKWHLDLELPLFSEAKDFLSQILSRGHDLVRGNLISEENEI
jgi:hypothetical protein